MNTVIYEIDDDADFKPNPSPQQLPKKGKIKANELISS